MIVEYSFVPKTPTAAERRELLDTLKEVWAVAEDKVRLLGHWKPVDATFFLWTDKGREVIKLAFDGTQVKKKAEMERVRNLIAKRGDKVLRAALLASAEVEYTAGMFSTHGELPDEKFSGVHVQIETPLGCALLATATVRKPDQLGHYLDPPQTQVFDETNLLTGPMVGLFRKNADAHRAH